MWRAFPNQIGDSWATHGEHGAVRPLPVPVRLCLHFHVFRQPFNRDRISLDDGEAKELLWALLIVVVNCREGSQFLPAPRSLGFVPEWPDAERPGISFHTPLRMATGYQHQTGTFIDIYFPDLGEMPSGF